MVETGNDTRRRQPRTYPDNLKLSCPDDLTLSCPEDFKLSWGQTKEIWHERKQKKKRFKLSNKRIAAAMVRRHMEDTDIEDTEMVMEDTDIESSLKAKKQRKSRETDKLTTDTFGITFC